MKACIVCLSEDVLSKDALLKVMESKCNKKTNCNEFCASTFEFTFKDLLRRTQACLIRRISVTASL